MRLIDADALSFDQRFAKADPDSDRLIPVLSVDKREIENAPTISIESMRLHGKWMRVQDDDRVCSECGIRIPEMYSNADSVLMSECRYCHYCGALMVE